MRLGDVQRHRKNPVGCGLGKVGDFRRIMCRGYDVVARCERSLGEGPSPVEQPVMSQVDIEDS